MSAVKFILDIGVIYEDTCEEETFRAVTSEWEDRFYSVGDELSEFDISELKLSTEVSDAVIRGIKLLGYGDASVRKMEKKLREKGYGRDAAERAAAAIEKLGYIDEKRVVLRKGDLIAERKLRGKRRVIEELMAAGYKREAVNEWARVTEVDFGAICARVIEKKGGIPPAGEREARKKLLSYLSRQGFSSDDVKNAARYLSEEE